AATAGPLVHGGHAEQAGRRRRRPLLHRRLGDVPRPADLARAAARRRAGPPRRHPARGQRLRHRGGGRPEGPARDRRAGRLRPRRGRAAAAARRADRARDLAAAVGVRPAPPGARGALARLPHAAGGRRLRAGARPLSRGACVTARLSAAHKAQRAARAALDRKALDLVVLDVQGVSTVTDYFLVCSGRWTTHLRSITDAIREELKQEGIRPLHAEGATESGWVLLDYGDVLMHVFLEDTRAYYALERLWGDAPSIPVDGRCRASCTLGNVLLAYPSRLTVGTEGVKRKERLASFKRR